MATDEEIYKLILKTEGDDKVKNLAAAAALAEQKFRALYDQLGSGHAATKAAASALVNVQNELTKVQSAAGLTANKLLTIGNTLDDLQYVAEQGLRPILNNIMQISPIAGIALMAIDQLSRHVGGLSQLWEEGKTSAEAARMEELSKKTEKTAEETERLFKWEQQRKNLEAQRGPTDASAAGQKAATDAVRNAGEPDIRRALGAIHGDAISNSIDSKIEEELANAKAGVALASGLEGDSPFVKSFRENAAKGLSRAQANRDQAYNDGLDKKQAELSDPKALARFADESQRRGLLTGDQVAQLRQSGAPKESKEEEFWRKQDEELENRKQEWLNSNRQADEAHAKAEEEYYRKQDEELENRKQTWLESNRAHDVEEDKRSEEYYRKQDEEHANKLQAWLDSSNDPEALEADRKRRQDEGVKRAKESAPGIENLIRTQLKAAGGSEHAAWSLTARLRGRFGDNAGAMVREQLGPAREEAMAEMMRGPRRKNSQVIDSAGLADAIQQSVGGSDVQHQQLDQLKRVNELLNRYLSRPAAGGAPVLRR